MPFALSKTYLTAIEKRPLLLYRDAFLLPVIYFSSESCWYTHIPYFIITLFVIVAMVVPTICKEYLIILIRI